MDFKGTEPQPLDLSMRRAVTNWTEPQPLDLSMRRAALLAGIGGKLSFFIYLFTVWGGKSLHHLSLYGRALIFG